jgi:RHS repeat-associated protein
MAPSWRAVGEHARGVHLRRAERKFTGKERDAETQNDYFGARFHESNLGRFLSPDVAGPDLNNPQTLNKYQYTRNNPLRYIDRNGLYEEDVHEGLTEVLAIGAGFDPETALAVGRAAQAD